MFRILLTKMWILVILLLPLLVPTVEAAYFIKTFTNETTWSEANQLCTLATPELRYTADGITIVNANISDIIAEGDTAWLGYAKVFQVFQYIGCVMITDIKSQSPPPLHIGPSDPGQCFSACVGDKLFGIGGKTNKTCYCFGESLSEDVNKTRNGCTSECMFSNAFACGGDNHMSLYEHVRISTLEDVTTTYTSCKLCCVYKPNAIDSHTIGTFLWGICSARILSMCESDSRINATKLNDAYRTWLSSSNACFSANLFPVTYKQIRFIADEELISGSSLWTGILRNHAVVKNTETPNALSKGGYIKRDDGKLQVSFMQPSSIKQGLCSGTGEERTTLPSTPSRSSIGPAEKPTITTTNAIVTSTSAVLEKTGSDTTHIHDSITDASAGSPLQSSDDESNIGIWISAPTPLPSSIDRNKDKQGVYVGVPVAIIVLIALAALGCVIWRRRQREPNQNFKKVTGRANASYDGGKYGDSDPKIKVRTEQSEDNQLHDYDRIQGIKGNINNEEDDAYDITNTKSKGATMYDTENEYNRINSVQKDETYNHVGNGLNTKKPIASSSTITDNTYDTSSNLQNKIGNRKANNSTDENYSHVKVNYNGKKQTDNVYAKANIVRSERNADKGEHEEADTTYDSADHRVNACGVPLNDNTYSHVNMKQTHGETDVYDTMIPS